LYQASLLMGSFYLSIKVFGFNNAQSILFAL
jgi:hypothetical protein